MKTQTIRFVFAAFAVIAGFVCRAADYTATDTQKVIMTTGDKLVPSTLSQNADALPAVATPIFRFDAKNRSGWAFDANDATKITAIPSLAGSRSLTLDRTGGNWSSSTWPIAPSLMEADQTLDGNPCVDFGVIGSTKGFLFDAVNGTNALDGIGTVFWVINSEEGGGTLLGGGSGTNNGGDNFLFMWRRGLSSTLSGAWSFTDPWSYLLRYYSGASGDIADVKACMGVAYHDGLATTPIKCGMNGGWEVISLQPKELGLTATGVGLGAPGTGMTANFSGGQRIAEIIVYGEILSADDRARVEQYLEKKWFNRDMRGWESNATADLIRASKNSQETYLSNGAVVDVEIPAGQTLGVGKLFGGRGGFAAVNVSGSGTLKLGDASAYQGTIRVKGNDGKLDFEKRSIPSSLPAGAVAHFDMSVAASIHSAIGADGLERITLWDNQSDFQYDGHQLCLAPNPDAAYADRTPWVVTNAFPGGKKALNFGYILLSGKHLVLCRADATATAVKLPGVTTVIAVVSPHSGATSIVGPWDSQDPAGVKATSYFNPSEHNRDWTSSLFSSAVITSINPVLNGASNNVAYIDGIKHDHTTGYPHPGWQVAAFEGPGSTIGAVGATAHHYYAGGAMNLAEIVMYMRPLSEQELKDASAYLSAKWFNRETPGYRKTADRALVDDVAVLDVEGDTEISVKEGSTVRIGKLMCGAKVRKTGGGTLEVATLENGAANLVVEDGAVAVAAAMAPEDNFSPAKDPAAHFDASASDSFILNESGDVKYVWMWYDKNGRNCAYWTTRTETYYEPWINTNDTLAGKQVVDFGAKKSGKYLKFAKPLDGVKAAFVVWGSQNGGGAALGSANIHGFYNDNMDCFRRIATATADDLILNEALWSQHVWGGQIYTNGLLSAYNKAKLSGDWDLVEIYAKGSGHVSALGYQRNGEISGGLRLAEVILYERELTDREKVATRNYLLDKWGLGPAQAEPESPAPGTVDYGEVAVDGTLALTADTGAKIAALTGDGDLAKSGAGTLSVENADGFTGTVSVAAGTLALTGRAATNVTAALETDGLIAQFDANYGITATSDVRGRTTVSEWSAKAGDFKAIPDSHGMNPIYAPRGLNGLPTVNMIDSAWGFWQYLRFTDLNGDFTPIQGIRSVLWVIGSQEGGGFILGGGTNAVTKAVAPDGCYNFHRGGAAGVNASDALLSGAAQSQVQGANWRMNGKKITATATGLSGGWDVVSMAFQETATVDTEADGFAFDGRFNPYIGGYSYSVRCGHQRLAEVLIYNRTLSAGEIAETEAYLMEKWNVRRPAASADNNLAVELAANTTLEMGEQAYLAGLSGAGSVNGDVTAGKLVADFDPETLEDGVTVAGKFTVPDGITVELKNLPQNFEGRVWTKLVSATSFDGLENLADAVFTGESVGTNIALLSLRDDAIWCKYFTQTGLKIILK